MSGCGARGPFYRSLVRSIASGVNPAVDTGERLAKDDVAEIFGLEPAALASPISAFRVPNG